MIKAVVVDDEQNARENLIRKVLKIDNSIQILAEAEDVDSAFDIITKHKPNVVFLDIEMPGKDGFELVNLFDVIDFEIVFITAYGDYAIKAFQHFAFNYLLKPLDTDLLEKVIVGLNNKLSAKKTTNDYGSLIQYINQSFINNKLGIPTESGIDLIEMSEIMSIESSEGYSIFKLSNGKQIISSKRFQYFEDKLITASFLKIHRSFIVNVKYIDAYHKVGFIKLSNGDELPVSRSLKNQVVQELRHGKFG